MPEAKRRAQKRCFLAAFNWFCPHLDLGLPKPSELSETHFCCLKPAPRKQTHDPGTFLSRSACSEQNREAQAGTSSCRSPPPTRGTETEHAGRGSFGTHALTGPQRPCREVAFGTFSGQRGPRDKDAESLAAARAPAHRPGEADRGSHAPRGASVLRASKGGAGHGLQAGNTNGAPGGPLQTGDEECPRLPPSLGLIHMPRTKKSNKTNL